MKKQFVAIFLAALMLFGLSVPAMAEGDAPSVYGTYAKEEGKIGVVTVIASNLTEKPNIIYLRSQDGEEVMIGEDVITYSSNGSMTATKRWNIDSTNGETYYSISVQKDAKVLATGYITFKGLPTPEKFTVTFVDGEEEVKVEVVDGKTIPADKVPAKADTATQTFLGWFEEGADKAFDLTAPIKADVILTARWEPKKLPDGTEITIKINGENKTVKVGDQLTEEDMPEVELKDDEVFEGWYIGKDKVVFPYTIEGEVAITAKIGKKPVDPGTSGDNKPVAPTGPSSKPGTTDPGTTDPGTTQPEQPGAVSSIFTDVSGHWAVNNGAIQYVYDNGLMKGNTDTTFAPNATTTRAQIMVILARRAGVNTEGGSIWYQKGLDWAVTNGVSDGTNPNNAITRQELAKMLYSVIGAPEVTGDLAAYPDASAVSDWAVNGMLWATQNGIITGTETGALNPTGNATRAEVATILMRFCQQYPVQAPTAE